MILQRGLQDYSQEGQINKEKIRVLFGVSESEPKIQELVYSTISSLPRDKYEITLLTCPGMKLIEWVDVLNRQRKLSINIITCSYLKNGSSKGMGIKTFFSLNKILKSGSFDIIRFYGHLASILGKLPAMFARIPKIYISDYEQHKNSNKSSARSSVAKVAEWLAGKVISRYAINGDGNGELRLIKKDKKHSTFKLAAIFRKQDENNEKVMSTSLRTNFSWILSGNVTYALSKGVLMILIAKLGSAKMVGEFSLALAITAPVFTLTGLRLRAITATDTRNEFSFSYYIRMRLMTTTIATLIILILVAILGYRGEFALVIIFIAIGKGIESISDIIFGLFENKEKMNIIGKSMMLKSVLSVVSMGITFKATGSLAGGAAGLAIAWLIVLVFYDLIRVRRYLPPKTEFELRNLIKLLKLCIPLGIVTALGAIEGNISTYIVQGHLGSETLGYYSAIANLIIVGDTIINSLGSSTTPRLAKYYASGDKKNYINTLMRLIVVSSGIGAIGLVLTAALGRILLSLLYSPAYGDYWNIFLLLMIASCLRYMTCCLNNSLTAARKLKIQPVINSVYTASILILSAILIPSRGIEGMAYAVIISSHIDFLVNLLTNVFTL